jgi:hypothetical protein
MRRAATGFAAISAVVVLAGCTSSPSTQADVCTSFKELGDQWLQGNGIIGNPLFRKADALSHVAGRYRGQDLSVDARALHRIAKSDSVSGQDLMNATTRIANLCGHPLAFGL